MTHRLPVIFSLLLALSACDQDERGTTAPEAALGIAERFQTQLIEAKPGDVIELPTGTFSFTRGLVLNADGVTIRGQGMDKTVLSFAGQIAGAEGLLVTASDFVIEDLAIEDTKGDGLKVNEGRNIVIRRVRTEWTGGPSTDNGAYGIYPVQTQNVLLEGNVAIGASDAGVYVGQSENVIVRGNRAEYNVAGIEVENTVDADVYGNHVRNNTGGILVFNMPALRRAGYGTRVFDNDVVENNTANFGHPGTPVASVVAGTGVIVNSNDGVEIFNNRFKDNDTAHIVLSSLYSTGYAESQRSADFDPYPESIFIHGNSYQGGGAAPGSPALTELRDRLFGEAGALPAILWDGYVDAAKLVDGALPDGLRICVDDGPAELLNADGATGFANPSMDQAPFRCRLDRLDPVVLDGL